MLIKREQENSYATEYITSSHLRIKPARVIYFSLIIALFLMLFFSGSYLLYSDSSSINKDEYGFGQKYSNLMNNLDYPLGFFDSSSLNVQRLSNSALEQKDPFIAGFLSWLMMGVGQIYCKEYTRGSIFIALDLLDKGAFIALMSYVNNKYSPKDDEIININWSTFDSNTKFLIIGYVIAKYGIRFYNVYDAIQAAKNYNRIHFLSRNSSKVSFNIDPDSFRIGYSLEFK